MKKALLERLHPSFLLGLFIVLLVCVFSSQTLDPVLVPRYIFTVAASLILVLIFLLKKKTWRSARLFLVDKSALPFYLFLAASSFSMLNALAINEAIFTLSSYFLFFILLILMINSFQGEMKNILHAVKGIIISGIIISSVGFYQLYLLKPHFPIPMDVLYEIKSSLGHKNLFASASLLTLFFSLFGVFNLSKVWRVIAAASATSSLAIILLLQTRSAIVALSVSILALGGIVFVSKFLPQLVERISTKVLWWAAAVLLVSFSAFYFFTDTTIDTEKISLSIQDQDDRSFTVKERGLLWGGTMQMVLTEDYFGVGPSNWKIHFPNYGSGIWRARQGMVQFQRPHNDYLWVLSESGILGLIGYLMMFGTVLLTGFKMQLKTNSKEERWLLRFAMATIISYMIVAVFSFPRERIVHQWLLFFSFAFILSIYLKQKVHTVKIWPIAILLGALLLPMIWIGADRYRGENLSASILKHREAGNWKALLENFKQAEKLHFYDMDPVSMPITFYAGLANLSLENYDDALAYFNKAYKIHPFNIHVINNLGGIHQLRKEYKTAIFYYQHVVKVAPYYKDGILNLSAVYFNNNQALDAYKVLLYNYDRFAPEDAAYTYYLIFELRTILLNLSEMEQYKTLFLNGSEFSDDWLLACHKEAIESGKEIENIILERLSALAD